MTKDELSEVSRSSLAPIDEAFADLYDKSLRYDAERFAKEVEKALERAPSLMDWMNIDALAEPLEIEVGRSMLKGLGNGST